MRILISLILLQPLLVNGQEILPDIDWSKAGLLDNTVTQLKKVDFQELREGSDLSPDEVLDQIIAGNPEGCIVYFPKGEYHFTKPIKLKSNFILKGEGAAYTTLIFDLGSQQSPIQITGKRLEAVDPVASNLSLGDTVISGAIRGLEANKALNSDYYLLRDIDEDLVTSDWSVGKTGQIISVNSIKDDQIISNEAIRRSYSVENKVMLIPIDMATNVGIENLAIVNNTKTEQQTSNIHFSYAANCWVDGVTSRKCNYSHVLFEFSSHCEVRNCNIMDAHDYGNGGKAYGITLQFATSDCLIIGNTLKRLRHAILLQAGANGNVVHANRSSEPFWEDVMLPSNAAGDLVLHGNYVYANLFQHNICQQIVIDNSHGKNGPDNVFFSNTAEGYGIIMNRNSIDGNIYFINNIIQNEKGIKGKYKTKGDVIEQFNQVKGKIKPKGSQKLNKESLR
ncbi:MAG: right-handed parallel beta-helix repeat-containing protein [Crocinitomicaceae bacterium]|nr:right-handed parallel beta-helix repeat-containing protein [Crocinitomicaceae bacterium]